MVYIYIDAYFSFELITFHFVQIFVLPDVPFAVVLPVVSSFVTFFICDVPSSLTTILYIILC